MRRRPSATETAAYLVAVAALVLAGTGVAPSVGRASTLRAAQLPRSGWRPIPAYCSPLSVDDRPRSRSRHSE